MGNPAGPRSLAAPHRMRCLLPLGMRVESCPLGWCGPAKPLRPPRFHTFPHQILIHLCTPHFGSTTSLPIPPPRPRPLPRLLPPSLRRRVPRRFFAACVVLSAGLASSPMASARAVSMLLLIHLLLGMRRSSWRGICSVPIQAPHLRAWPLRLLILLRGSPCRNGCVWYLHRTVRQGPPISFFFCFPHCTGHRGAVDLL